MSHRRYTQPFHPQTSQRLHIQIANSTPIFVDVGCVDLEICSTQWLTVFRRQANHLGNNKAAQNLREMGERKRFLPPQQGIAQSCTPLHKPWNLARRAFFNVAKARICKASKRLRVLRVYIFGNGFLRIFAFI
jgi:hypothetical protein